MAESKTDQAVPLDLATIGDFGPEPKPSQALAEKQTTAMAASDPRLSPQDKPARIVEVANLAAEELAAAQQSAERIDFRRTNTLLSHGDGVLAEISQASRSLLTGVRLGDAGEVGRIAAAVLDGIKILRIQDLQAEAAAKPPAERKGLIGKLLGAVGEAHTAFKGFQENRKQFLALMDQEEAKARKAKGDLSVMIEHLDEQGVAIRKSLHRLKIEIAAGQIALDRGEEELERLRQHAIGTQDPGDAADVHEFRGALANFRSKIADMRESLVGSAMLVPIIGQNKQAAEIRLMKVSTGMLVVIPKLMAVASQAVVQVKIQNAAKEAEHLDEASRQLTLLAAKGANEAATSAARSLAGDPRNLEVLSFVADETVRTMNEVIDIEREVAAGDRDREAKLAEVRDKLIRGLQGATMRAIEAPAKGTGA